MFKTENLDARILRHLAASGPTTALKLAQAFGAPTTIIVAELNLLAERNFITREINDLDVVNYRLAERGTNWIAELEGRAASASQIAELQQQLVLSQMALAAANGLLSELTNDDDQTKYMVTIDGKQAPRVLHDTLESAKQEALRLAAQDNNKNATIRILTLVDTLEATTTEVTTATWASEAAACDGNCEGCPNNA